MWQRLVRKRACRFPTESLIWYARPGGAAANAGLRGLVRTEDGDVELGDIIVAVDGEKVANKDDLL